MITKITGIDELKQMFIEILLNKTDKISDISNESVLNGIAYSCSKLAQRLLTNQAVVEGHIFPDTAYGEYLDKLAALNGISPRRKNFGSSTYVRVEGDPGTNYDKNVVKFVSTSGISFVPEENCTIDNSGFAYIKVRSQQVGETTNVDALTINTILTPPSGHIAVTNEYRATGGMNDEDDDTFRMRIKESVNQLARTTIAYIEQVFMKINKKVLRVMKGGIDANGRLNLIVVSVNGQNFSDEEFDELISRSEEYLSLNELLRDTSSGFALKLNNVNWLPIDIDFRVSLDPSFDSDAVRREMQIKITKLFDYRFWNYGDKVEWENILYAVKGVEGVRYVPDTHFIPRADINVPQYRLPRLRGFVLRDLNGDIINDNYNILSNFNFPNDPDVAFSESVLNNI